jgi:hypothetical protein
MSPCQALALARRTTRNGITDWKTLKAFRTMNNPRDQPAAGWL